MHLFDRGFVGRLLCDGLEQVAAEVIQPNLEPVETFSKVEATSQQNAVHLSVWFRTIVD